MFVGVLELTLSLPYARSLKAKRSVVRSAIERARAKFKVAIAEVGDNDSHGRAVIGVAAVSNDQAHINSVLDKVRDTIEAQVVGEAEIASARIELMNVSFEHDG